MIIEVYSKETENGKGEMLGIYDNVVSVENRRGNIIIKTYIFGRNTNNMVKEEITYPSSEIIVNPIPNHVVQLNKENIIKDI